MKAAPLILIVDDFPDALEMYEASLQFAGFRTLSAATGLDAIRLAITEQPDVILMDGGLPGMTGWQATTALKEDPRTRDIIVLMLTGHVLLDAKKRAADAGADGFIAKPCLPDELIREIQIVLGKKARPPHESRVTQRRRSIAATAATARRIKKARDRP